MNVPVAGLYITANSTIESAQVVPTLLDTGWTADESYLKGDGSVDADAATGKLTLVPGVYEITFNASVEAAETSGSATSGDTQGELIFQIFRGGTLVPGSKAIVEADTVGAGRQVVITMPVTITEAQLEASTATNYVQIYVGSTDSSGNDYLVKEARFYAKRLS